MINNTALFGINVCSRRINHEPFWCFVLPTIMCAVNPFAEKSNKRLELNKSAPMVYSLNIETISIPLRTRKYRDFYTEC